MKKLSVAVSIILCLLLGQSVFADSYTASELIEKALAINPSLQSANLTIEDAQIELQRSLYNAASLSKNALDDKREAVKKAESALENARIAVEEETLQLAFKFIKDHHSVREKEIALLQARRDLEIAVVRYDRGTISLSDLILAEDKVVSEEDSYKNACDALALASENLKEQIGAPFEQDIEVNPMIEPLILDISLVQIEQALELTDSQYLQAAANVMLRKNELKQMQEDNEALLSIRQKEIALEKAIIELSIKEKLLASTARNTYSVYNQTVNMLENAGLEVKRQTERLERAAKQYEDGLINLNNFTDIGFQVEIAKMKEVEAMWEVHISSVSKLKLLASSEEND